MILAQGADRYVLTSARSPKIVAGAHGDASQPMFKGHRVRKLRQIDVRFDEDFMDEFPYPISRHTPADDAADVTLIPVDELGKPFGLALSDPTDKIALLARRLSDRKRVIGHRQMSSPNDPSNRQHRSVAHDTTVEEPSECESGSAGRRRRFLSMEIALLRALRLSGRPLIMPR